MGLRGAVDRWDYSWLSGQAEMAVKRPGPWRLFYKRDKYVLAPKLSGLGHGSPRDSLDPSICM